VLGATVGASVRGLDDRKTQFLTTADGRRLCFAEWGRADGVPVFALHGSPGSRLGVAAETEAVVTDLGGRQRRCRQQFGDSTKVSSKRHDELLLKVNCRRSWPRQADVPRQTPIP
jgi:hypothetical protein